MHPQVTRHRKPVKLTLRQAFGLGGLLLATLMLAAFVVEPGATADSGLSPLELAQRTRDNCQVLLAHTASGSAAHNRAQACINDQTAIINALTATPSPSGSPSASPSSTVSPSPSPSPTVPPSPSVSPTATTPPATTPPPSPSPSTTGLLTNCFSQLAACGYPTLATTGIPAGITLTAYTGPLNITTSTTIDGKSIGCGLTISGGTVVIRNSKITGPCFFGVDMEGGTLSISDSEVDCTDNTGTGIAWAHFAALRVYIHRCENALEMGAGSLVVDSYLAGSQASTTAHGDDIQSQGGDGVTVRHNTFGGLNPITSSIITNPTASTHWTIVDNFMSAGALSLYCSSSGSSGWVVTGNRFYPVFGPDGKNLYTEISDGVPTPGADLHAPAYGFTSNCSGVGTWSGNFQDDNLNAVGR